MIRSFGYALAVTLSIVASLAAGAHAAPPDSFRPRYAALEVREARVPMRDGKRLAVNLFFPRGISPKTRLPVILEYLPYRKDDWSVARDYSDYSYFVRRGYVAARLIFAAPAAAKA